MRAVVQLLVSEALADLPCPDRSVEIRWPKVAIEQPDGSCRTVPLHLRANPIEAGLLALDIEHAIGPKAMSDARRMRAHGMLGPDTGVLKHILDRVREL
ncbi:hypothetical protein LO772_15545 [Yinghuangia sp. ASG 101]|uniref:hypothetical protein n=1 Tax=Yinghuangia sp. ASG 101 TaxID=2896848 RepID=UPI001E30DDA8|nr:hypothetical protein [Yinghuangia sp. ASG 101]UGQ14857.1 hypothetical protein LO772_15545 [Yinghuangia sp. ASG 101]